MDIPPVVLTGDTFVQHAIDLKQVCYENRGFLIWRLRHLFLAPLSHTLSLGGS